MEVKLLHENLKSVFLIVFLETQPCIVMNCGMCRINKGARLKRADICPNLYFFTSTIFHKIHLFRMLKKFHLCSLYTTCLKRLFAFKRLLLKLSFDWVISVSFHFMGSYSCHFIAGHIHIHVFTLPSLQSFLATCGISFIFKQENVATIYVVNQKIAFL